MFKFSRTVCVFILTVVFNSVNEASCEASVEYLGCFEDGGPSNRLMKDHHENFHGTLTPEKCNEHCRGKGFAYAGTQYSFECFCSKAKPPGTKKRLESDCNSKCAGDETKTCGGNNRLAIFTTSFPDPTGNTEEVLKPIGCFKDSDKKRLLSEYRQDFPGSLTNQKCVRLCAKRGYHYAGVEYGKECYCGNIKPTFKDYASDEDCSKRCEGDSNQLCGGGWKIYVFKTSNADPEDTLEAGKYIGCYRDNVDARSLDGHMEDFGGFLTPFKCSGLCYSKGFLYSGTQFSYQCFCGDKPPNPILKVAERECNTPCTGNRAEMCGGESRNSIRETGIPDLPVDGKYLGCFNDKDNQIYGGVKLTFDKTNSPKRCMNYCSQLGYKYSGVEYGKECFCGNLEPKADLAVNPEDCNNACSGDPEESCGAGWRLAVYKTTSSGSGSPIITPIRVSTPKPCERSETVVTGKGSVCRGDVIFEDNFNTPLGNTWTHVVKIPDDPEIQEFEYAVFTADSLNCFTRKNKLIIKPTFFNDTFVQSGHLQLNGCTGRPGTRQCELQAASYNILPPLATARIHTRNSFSFRYGIVEIRAKLPLGDWLVPELWLEPRSHYYGPGYTSGRIRIAMNRGNSDYKCQEEDYGSNRLESGVMMGPSCNVQKRSLTTKLPDNWHDHFHNYTLIWSPDNIHFKIDNGQSQELIPSGRTLCEVIEFNNDECLIWSSGSRIAPFDKDFYISLGLSVGNARDFPDYCKNRGKLKSFKNSDPKAMLKFWLDKENWKATWSEEHSSLIIEHIRVIAL